MFIQLQLRTRGRAVHWEGNETDTAETFEELTAWKDDSA